jgi:hypothetical protein
MKVRESAEEIRIGKLMENRSIMHSRSLKRAWISAMGGDCRPPRAVRGHATNRARTRMPKTVKRAAIEARMLSTRTVSPLEECVLDAAMPHSMISGTSAGR